MTNLADLKLQCRGFVIRDLQQKKVCDKIPSLNLRQFREFQD